MDPHMRKADGVKTRRLDTTPNDTAIVPQRRAESYSARVLEHKALSGSGAAKHVIALELASGMIIYDVLILEKDGRRWASPPSRIRVWGGEVKFALDGTPIRDKVISFTDRARADAFSAVALDALDRYLAGEQ